MFFIILMGAKRLYYFSTNFIKVAALWNSNIYKDYFTTNLTVP